MHCESIAPASSIPLALVTARTAVLPISFVAPTITTLIVLWAGGGGVCCMEQRTFAAAAFLLVAVFPHARIRIGWHSETILMELVVLGQSSLVSVAH